MKTGTEQRVTTVPKKVVQGAYDMYQGNPPRLRILFLEFKEKGMSLLLHKHTNKNREH